MIGILLNVYLIFTDLSCGNDVVLGAEVNAVLGFLHPANHGARKVDPPAYFDTLNSSIPVNPFTSLKG